METREARGGEMVLNSKYDESANEVGFDGMELIVLAKSFGYLGS